MAVRNDYIGHHTKKLPQDLTYCKRCDTWQHMVNGRCPKCNNMAMPHNIGAEYTHGLGCNQKKVVSFMQSTDGHPAMARDISAGSGISFSLTKGALYRLKSRGLVDNRVDGWVLTQEGWDWQE